MYASTKMRKIEELFREIRFILLIFKERRLPMIGLIILAIMTFIAIFAPLIVPYPEDCIGRATRVEERFKPPSLEHLFGTDLLGRDVFSRVLWGARYSLTAAVVIVAISVAIGWPLGVIAGYKGGIIKDIIMRITDIFLVFPSLVLALIIAYTLGPSLINSMIAVSATWWPWYTRLAQVEASSLREQPFIEAARALGLSDAKIIFRHIFPNTMTPIIIQASADLGTALLIESGLSFLGLGAQRPTPEWGLMISEGRQFVFSAWWCSLFPGIFIFITALAFNLIGDGLREALDPKLRKIRRVG